METVGAAGEAGAVIVDVVDANVGGGDLAQFQRARMGDGATLEENVPVHSFIGQFDWIKADFEPGFDHNPISLFPINVHVGQYAHHSVRIHLEQIRPIQKFDALNLQFGHFFKKSMKFKKHRHES